MLAARACMYTSDFFYMSYASLLLSSVPSVGLLAPVIIIALGLSVDSLQQLAARSPAFIGKTSTN